MKQQAHRDMMAEFYRLYERFETVPKTENKAYWDGLVDGCTALDSKYKGAEPLRSILYGLIDGLQNEYKQKGGTPT